MSEHPNVTTINRMTAAVFEKDVKALGEIFTADLTFHARGALPFAGDHHGVDGFVGALGTLFELTDGDVKLEQLCCLAEGNWATEFERAVLGRNGRTLESDDVFVYRFESGRIAEIWMLWAPAGDDATFWQ